MPPRRRAYAVMTRQAPEPRWQRWAALSTAIAAVGALAVSTISIYYTGRSVGATREQVRLQEQGQVTDRYSRAVEQLGSDQTMVRVGAVYALERLMRESWADQPTIIQVLSGFVRERARNRRPPYDRVDVTWPKLQAPAAVPRPPATDVQAAVTVLGQRLSNNDAGVVVDFSGSDLSGATLRGYFRGANLSRASLTEADLEGADLRLADLSEADLAYARAREAHFAGANLSNARLVRTDLSFADFSRATLVSVDGRQVDLRASNLSEAMLTRADLTGAQLVTVNIEGAGLAGVTGLPGRLSCILYDEVTVVPAGVTLVEGDC